MGTSGNPAKKAATAKKTAAKKTATKKAPAKKTAPSRGVTPPTEVSGIGAFKQRREGINIKLPSGLVVRARKVELQTFIRQGNIPNPLMGVVSEALEKGKKADIPKMVGVEDDQLDMEMVNEMYDMVNSVVVASVTQPEILPLPTAEDVEEWNTNHPGQQVKEPKDLRDDDLLYVDEVEDLDKMFIFQWASGGTSDLERFLEETGADMATLAEMQGAASASK